MATNATIFRWNFGEISNQIVETTLNPYIHNFHGPGTYNVSHQSCYPCASTNQLVCSNGWCTKSVIIVSPSDNGVLVATAGLFGLFIIAKEDNCCKFRDRCVEKREICKNIKPEDNENIKACKIIEKKCATRLKDCKKKCADTGHIWKPLPYTCLQKREPHKEICQIIDNKKYIEKKKKDQNK